MSVPPESPDPRGPRFPEAVLAAPASPSDCAVGALRISKLVIVDALEVLAFGDFGVAGFVCGTPDEDDVVSHSERREMIYS